MSKRNQITTKLDISADAQLKNSREFIKDIEKIAKGLDVGSKLYSQLDKAKKQLNDCNKVLEKINGKSIVDDKDLQAITKAGKEIANVMSKVSNLYDSYSSDDLRKISKEYVAEIEAREKAALKIKEEYNKKTGKIYDKEITNYGKLKAKIKELEKEQKKLSETGIDSLVQKQVEETNKKLEEQKKKLQEIEKLRANGAKAFTSAANASAKKSGYENYDQLKNTKVLTEKQVANKITSEGYAQQKAEVLALENSLKNILNIKDQNVDLDAEATKMAKEYNLQNVNSLATLQKEVKLRREVINSFKNDKTKLRLQYEKAITAELRKQEAIKNAQTAAKNAGEAAELAAIQSNPYGYQSKAGLNAGYTATTKSVESLQATLSEDGLSTIATNAANLVTQRLDKIATSLAKLTGEAVDIEEATTKLSTQSERAADEGDVKETGQKTINEINANTNIDGEKTRTSIEGQQDILKNVIDGNIMTSSGKTSAIETLSGEIENYTAGQDTPNMFSVSSSSLAKQLQEKLQKYKKLIKSIGETESPEQQQIIHQEAESLWDEIGEMGRDALRDVKAAAMMESDEASARLKKYVDEDGSLNRKAKRNKYTEADMFKDVETTEIVSFDVLPNFDYLSRTFSKEWETESTALREQKEHIEAYAQKVRETTQTTNNLTNATKVSSSALKEHADEANRNAIEMEEGAKQSAFLSSTFDDIRNKIGYFLSLNYVFDQMTRKISEAVRTTKEMDQDMTQIGLVLNKTAGQVWKNFNTYSQMAERLNTTTSQVTNSMKLFYQQGLNTSEVNKMVEASAIAAALGESTLAEASETLTSILNSYNLSANRAMEVTDKISQIAIVSAADFGELSTAIEKVASSAASAGLDLDHMMGYLAKMIETTREAPTNIGTALKTIVANFTQFKEDPSGLSQEGSEINKVDKALKSVGISLTDANGEVRDLGEVLDELGGIWEGLTRSQRAYLATQIAGTRQQSRFYALMNDYERTLELVSEGSNSAGKAQQQFALYSNSLEAAANRLTNQWEKFFNDITKGNGLVANFTNALTGLMKVVNTIGPIGTALGLGEGVKLARDIVSTFDSLKGTLKKRADNSFDFEKEKSNITADDSLSEVDKINKLDKATQNYHKNQNDSLKGLNEAQLAYISSMEDINKEQELFGKRVKTLPKNIQPVAKSLNGLKTGAKKTFASMKLGIEQVKAGLASIATHFAILAAVTLTLKLVSAAFKGIKSALNINTEAYVENAEKARENAENIEGLTSEYKELSKKVNKTAEEQERLKEITEEVTKVDAALGQQLKNNVNNYEANIKAMEDYAKAQEMIAAQETVKALKSEGGILNNLFTILDGDTWTGWFGSESEKNQLRTEQQNNWRALGSAKAAAAGLNDTQASMVNNYVEDLIRIQQEEQNWDDKAYKYNIGELDGLVEEFIQSLRKMTKAQQDSYNTYLENLNNGKNTLGTMMANLWELDLPDEVKANLYDQVSSKEQDIRNRVNNNKFITDKDAGFWAARNNMSITASSKLFNTDTSSFTTAEKDEYERIVAQILTGVAKDANDNYIILADEYNKAVQQGSAGLTNFSKRMVKLGALTEKQGQLLEVANAQLASLSDLGSILEELKSFTSEDWRNGSMSQLSVIEQMLSGVLNLSDIEISSYESQNYDGSKEIQYLFVPKINSLLTKIDNYITQLTQQYTNTENTLGVLLQEAIGDRKTSTESIEAIKTNAEALKTSLETNKIIAADLKKLEANKTQPMVSHLPAGYSVTNNPNFVQPLGTPVNRETAGITTLKPVTIPNQNTQTEKKQEVTLAPETIEFLQSRIGSTEGPKLDTSGERYGYRNTAQTGAKNGIKESLEEVNAEIEKNQELVRSNVYTIYLAEGAEAAEDYAKQFGNLGTEALDYAKTQEKVIAGLRESQEQAKKTREAIEGIYKANVTPLEKFTAVFQQLEVSNAVAKNVQNYADAMVIASDATKNNHQNVAQLVTQYPSLIECVDATSEGWRFNSEKIKENAKAQVQNEIESIDSKIRGTEAILNMLGLEEKGYQEWDTAVVSDIEGAMSYQDSLGKNSQDTSQDVADSLSNETENYAQWGNKVIEAYRKVGEARNEYLRGLKSEEEYNYTVQATLGGVKLGGAQVETDGGDTKAKTPEEIAEEQKQRREQLKKTLTEGLSDSELNELKDKYKRSLELLKSQRGDAQNRLNNIGGWLQDLGNGGSGGGSKDAFEPIIEKLEKFYNYLRQLEELEARINRIREKRNLIDTGKNYYIDKLQQENDLLREQQSIYNSYIRDQGVYLDELKGQIQSQFGDWAYFNEDGVIQVTQTEFTANSEEEEKRLNLFLELVELYKEEYNTREENINTLYDLEHSQLENIQEMYDKVLARIQDINEALNRQADLLDHQSTMSFSNIGKFGIMDDKALVAVEGLKKSQAYLNDYEGQIKALGDEVRNGPFSELLVWDETLQVWRTNEEALNDPAIVKKYEAMGYTWQDIDTYCRSVAIKSQSIRDSWNETEDAANAFAELLKSLIDDRISLIQDLFGAATDELNKVFDTFDNKITDLDNQNDLFGTTSESLEEKYLTLVTAATVLKQTIQSLEDNRGSIIERIQKDYPEYIEMINGIAVVNKQAIEESNNLSDEQKAELLQLYGVLEAADGQITEMNDKLIDYFSNMMEMEEAKREAIIEMKQAIHDELMARDQEEIDNLQAKYDKMSQLDNEYYSELQQRINDARDLRDRRQESANIGQMQARLAVLKADNSGTYNSELIELQKQIQQALQTQADNDVNRELERIQREQQQREEDRQLTISAMENVLTFKDDNNWYWQEAQRIWDEGPESVTGFLRSSREYANISDEQRNKLFEDLTTSMNTAFTTLQTAAGQTAITSDGVVTTQAGLIMDDLDYIQSQLGEGSTLATKIDWSNTQNVNKLTALDSTVTGLPNTIKTNMDTLFNEKIQPGVDGVVNTITSYLGTDSAIWKKLDGMNTNLGTLTSTKYYDNLNGIVNALTGTGENSIASILKTSKTEYLKSTGDIYKWLDETYRKEHAPEPETKTEATVTPPSNTDGGSSGSNSGGGNGGGAGNSVTTAPELKVGSAITVKPGTRWYYDSYGTNPSGTARGGKIKHINLKGSHQYNIDGLGWIKKTDIVGYSKGGYVDYTGIANVHGSSTSPEAFLNAKQTRLFEALRDNLTKTASNRVYDKTDDEITKEEYNIDNINIQVQQIADVDAIDKVTKRVKEEIYKDSIGHNNMAVRRR